MIKKILLLLIGLVIIGGATAIYYDNPIKYNDEIGYYAQTFFPIRESTSDSLLYYFPTYIDDIDITQNTTIIDLNDDIYEESPQIFNIAVPQIIKYEEKVYIEEIWKRIIVRDWLYMEAVDGKKVQCKPWDMNGDQIYEMVCVEVN